MSSTGTTTWSSTVLRRRRLHDRDRPAAGQEGGHLLDRADGRRQADALRRLVEQRVEPLQGDARGGRRAWSRTTACTSSTITVSTPRSASRAGVVSSRNSDSGVVIRMSAGRRANGRRSSAGVSPERMATVTSGAGRPSRGGRLPDAGQRRAQVALDVDRQRLERADVEHPAAALRVVRRRRLAASRSSETGTRPASCRDRSARPPGCARRCRSPPRRPAGPASARRRRRRTRPGWRGRTGSCVQSAARV